MNEDYVLITGASSDIGGEIVRSVAAADTVILAHYHSRRAKVDSLAAEAPGRVVPIGADLNSTDGIATLLQAVEAECSAPNKIVHLAAPAFSHIRFGKLEWDDFQRQLNVQLRSAVAVMHRFLPALARAKSGKAVFVLSSATVGIPPIAMAHYVTAKYALLGLMKSLASEYTGKGVNINAVSPSMVETGFWSGVPQEYVALAAHKHPRKRNATPRDVAPLVKFLLSKDADYMSGVNIPVAGGAVSA